jgi:hypothetical protein
LDGTRYLFEELVSAQKVIVEDLSVIKSQVFWKVELGVKLGLLGVA